MTSPKVGDKVRVQAQFRIPEIFPRKWRNDLGLPKKKWSYAFEVIKCVAKGRLKAPGVLLRMPENVGERYIIEGVEMWGWWVYTTQVEVV